MKDLEYGIIQAIDEFGRDIVGEKRLTNILADLGALKNKATKRILHTLVELGILKKLLVQSSDSLSLFKKEKIHQVCVDYGYQSLLVELVFDTFCEVLFGTQATSNNLGQMFEGFSIDPFKIDTLPNVESKTIIPELRDTEQQEDPIESFYKPTNVTRTSSAHKYEQMGISVVTNEIQEASKIDIKPTPYNPHEQFRGYLLPKIDLLEESPCRIEMDEFELTVNKQRIVQTLLSYNIPVSKIDFIIGPTVILYEISLTQIIPVSRIQRLENDLSFNFSGRSIRITQVPYHGTIGIEVPKDNPQTVSIRSVLSSKKYQDSRRKMNLPITLGITPSNEVFVEDLTQIPHLLIGGASGMGKSVCLNVILASLLFSKHPSELKFVLIDPRMVEFSLYEKIERYFLAKLPGEYDGIITETSKAIRVMNSLCIEMDSRYNLLKNSFTRYVEDYNQKFVDGLLDPYEGHRYLPYLVVVIDELADIIMTGGKEIEIPITKLTAKARAVGIHLIISTQNPSPNVITRLIKANIPGRIAFRMVQSYDSRTFLDNQDGNYLIGKGDMLFSLDNKINRIQGAFINTAEVMAMVDSIYRQVGPEMTYILPEPENPYGEGGEAGANIGDRDAMFDDVARFIVGRQISSVSCLQRQFGIGYNRAARLMDQMEAAGIVGRANGAKPRDILVDMVRLEAMLSSM